MMRRTLALATLSLLAGLPAAAGVLVPDKEPTRPLRLRKEQIKVSINNQVMQARVNQVFENRSAGPVEATYIFKPPAGAAVSGFSTWVDGRKVDSRVQEKGKAAATYAAARKAGRSAALLSRLKRGAFSMKVARIGANQTRRVELRYERLLEYRAGTVSLRLPLRTPGVSNVERGDLSVVIDIRDGKEITAVRSSTLPIRSRRIDAHRWQVSYTAKDSTPKRDLVLQYDVRSKDIGLTFLTHRVGGQDGYFMLLAAPQELTTNRDIVKKDVVFVFDVSGSMHGEKIRQARGALKKCLSFMNRGDSFGIVAFSDGTSPFRSRLQPLTPGAVREAGAFIDRLIPGGGTNIDLALREGLRLLGRSARPKVVVFLTDGQATTGVTDSAAILAAVTSANTQGGRIFTFGVGTDVNRPLLERLGRTNRGTVDFIRGGAALEKAVATFYAKIARPVLSDLALDFGTVTAAMTYPSVLPDLYKGSQLLLIGRYRGDATVQAGLAGRLNGKRKRYAFSARFPAEDNASAFLPRLWANRRIAYLMSQIRMHGESDEGRREVIRLAKKHHIATRYTSLVATAPRARVASLSPARIKPGDPVIKIRAPREALAVTVVFPFGVTKAARYEADRDLWSVRFLIPRASPDGSYPVQIVVNLPGGAQRTYRVHYTVDTAAPKVALKLSGPATPGRRVTLTARQIITEQDLRQAPGYRPARSKRLRRIYARLMADSRQVRVRLPSGKLLELKQERPGLWRGLWRVPADLVPGQHALRVIAIDVAGNRSSAARAITVIPAAL